MQRIQCIRDRITERAERIQMLFGDREFCCPSSSSSSGIPFIEISGIPFPGETITVEGAETYTLYILRNGVVIYSEVKSDETFEVPVWVRDGDEIQCSWSNKLYIKFPEYWNTEDSWDQIQDYWGLLHGENSPAYSKIELKGMSIDFSEPSNGRWCGGAIGMDGKIYCAPKDCSTILVIDPKTDTAQQSNFGLDLSQGGTRRYKGGILAKDGLVYLLPASAPNFIVIDTVNQIYSQETWGADVAANGQWRGGILHPNGKIYLLPQNTPDLLVIDTINHTASREAMGSSYFNVDAYCGGNLGQDGKIYCVPYNAPDVLIIDPATNSVERKNFGLDLTGDRKWRNAVNGPDGKIYCCPHIQNKFLVIDPISQTAELKDYGLVMDTTFEKYRSGVVGADGLMYFIPYDTNKILVVDAYNDSAWFTDIAPEGPPILSGGLKWRGAFQALNGAIYGIPALEQGVLKLSPYDTTIIPDPQVLLSVYYNKK